MFSVTCTAKPQHFARGVDPSSSFAFCCLMFGDLQIVLRRDAMRLNSRPVPAVKKWCNAVPIFEIIGMCSSPMTFLVLCLSSGTASFTFSK